MCRPGHISSPWRSSWDGVWAHPTSSPVPRSSHSHDCASNAVYVRYPLDVVCDHFGGESTNIFLIVCRLGIHQLSIFMEFDLIIKVLLYFRLLIHQIGIDMKCWSSFNPDQMPCYMTSDMASSCFACVTFVTIVRHKDFQLLLLGLL